MADQTTALDIYYSPEQYQDHLRRIRYFDQEHKRSLIYLTNNFTLDAVIISDLYRSHWQIELFF